jgi:hypothetical protein
VSDHDPFDGIYDRSMIPKSETDKPAESEDSDTLYDSASVHAEPQAEVSQDVQPSVDTVYSAPFLRRQSKADLQKIARSKGLDDSGTRDEMIDEIEEHQNA